MVVNQKEFARMNNTTKPSNEENFPIIKFRNKALKPKQVKILEMIGEGYSNDEISELLKTSKRNVEYHIQTLRKMISDKIGYRLNDRELVLFARDMLDGYKNYKKTIKEEKKLLEETMQSDEINSIPISYLGQDANPTVVPIGFKTFNGELKAIETPRKYKFEIQVEEVSQESLAA